MKRLLPAILLLSAVLVAACRGSGGDAPAAPAGNAQLSQGREVWVARCARCHGGDGGGGIGPQISDGHVTKAYPDVDEEIKVVAKGTGRMPGFDKTLSESEIAAVVAYTREVLATR